MEQFRGREGADVFFRRKMGCLDCYPVTEKETKNEKSD